MNFSNEINYVENYRRKINYENETSFELMNLKFYLNSRKLRKLDLSKLVLVEGNGFFIEN